MMPNVTLWEAAPAAECLPNPSVHSRAGARSHKGLIQAGFCLINVLAKSFKRLPTRVKSVTTLK